MTVTDLTARAYTIPTDQPEADGTLDLGRHHHGRRHRHRRRPAGPRLDLRRARGGRCDQGSAGAGGERRRHAPRFLGWPSIWLEPAATWVGPVSPPAPSPRSTSPSGTCGRASSASRSRTCSAGRADSVPVYGSGGFTTYDDETTATQLTTWVDDWAIPRAKIKIGQSWGAVPAATSPGSPWPVE